MKSKKPRRSWRQIFRGDEPSAFLQQDGDGLWSVTIDGLIVGVFGSEQTAEDFVAKLNTKTGASVGVIGATVAVTVGVR